MAYLVTKNLLPLKVLHIARFILATSFFLVVTHAAHAQDSSYSSLSELQLEKKLIETSLAPPVTLMASGGVTMLVSAPFVAAAMLQRLNCRSAGTPCAGKGALIASASSLGVGAVLWVSGITWLVKRSEKRQSIEDELRARRRKRTALSLYPLKKGGGFSLQIRF